MEIPFTKFCFKHLGNIFIWIFATIIAIMAFAGGSMITYYCVPNAPIFFGLNIANNPSCSFIVATSFIVSCAIALIILLFCLTLLADTITWVFKKIRIYRKATRQARIGINATIIKNDIYVFVHNLEYWLRSEKVIAETKFIYGDHVTNSHIKWLDTSASKITEISIPRKSTKTMHFATINANDDTFTLHKTDGDETFPKGEHSYTFPLRVYGVMFLGRKIQKAVFDKYVDVVIDYKGKDKVSVKIKSNN